MDKHVSAKAVVFLLPDYYNEFIRTTTDYVKNGDVLVSECSGDYYFRYISDNRIEGFFASNYFVYGKTLYCFNEYCHAYDFIESKVKETVDKDTFDWIKKLVNIRSRTNEEIRIKYSERGYKIKRLQDKYDRLSWASLMLIILYVVTLISMR